MTRRVGADLLLSHFCRTCQSSTDPVSLHGTTGMPGLILKRDGSIRESASGSILDRRPHPMPSRSQHLRQEGHRVLAVLVPGGVA